MLSRSRALSLLLECDGDDIWPVEHCVRRGIPQAWIDQLVDNFESGFTRPDQTIFFEGELVNQFRGIRDVDLARKLGVQLGIDVDQIEAISGTRRGFVNAIKEAVEET